MRTQRKQRTLISTKKPQRLESLRSGGKTPLLAESEIWGKTVALSGTNEKIVAGQLLRRFGFAGLVTLIIDNPVALASANRSDRSLIELFFARSVLAMPA